MIAGAPYRSPRPTHEVPWTRAGLGALAPPRP